jgi:hypothetical protein
MKGMHREQPKSAMAGGNARSAATGRLRVTDQQYHK